ncbi:SMI1/KNR4 family protein [Clostridium estertheticum]|uniref:SMI1/KNR4 family protein n=1 Tax=Clostridium estertheticum TaxID=238834 RepID=A0A5N7J1F4_9CLOT|nr:SMI1/KNR4 family protein [Clostridium estertheticum]MPQ31907.1 SMI1/KNR4 family protein [Clostridium estertheticum]MPQ62574.1 SMI1/KNR4 family protein [Clostridium estertheticum]
MNIKGYGKAQNEDVLKFQQEIGIELPADYKNFLYECNGGVPEIKYSTFKIEDIQEEVGLQVLYGLGLDKGLDLRGWNDEYNDELFENSIIIGNGLGIGFIVLINSSEESGIYFWDHTYEFDSSTDEENTYKISNTFKEFLEKIKTP